MRLSKSYLEKPKDGKPPRTKCLVEYDGIVKEIIVI
jgi:hypothetical protein